MIIVTELLALLEQFAVDPQIEERELADSPLHLKSHPDGPDLPEFEGRLLADQPALVPRLPPTAANPGFHGILPVVEGDPILPCAAESLPRSAEPTKTAIRNT